MLKKPNPKTHTIRSSQTLILCLAPDMWLFKIPLTLISVRTWKYTKSYKMFSKCNKAWQFYSVAVPDWGCGGRGDLTDLALGRGNGQAPKTRWHHSVPPYPLFQINFHPSCVTPESPLPTYVPQQITSLSTGVLCQNTHAW